MTNLYKYAQNGYTENYVAVYRNNPSIFSVFKSRKSAESDSVVITNPFEFDILTFRQAAKLYPDYYSYSKKIIRIKHYYTVKSLVGPEIVAETSTKKEAIKAAKEYALEHKSSMIVHSVDARTGDVLDCEFIVL